MPSEDTEVDSNIVEIAYGAGLLVALTHSGRCLAFERGKGKMLSHISGSVLGVYYWIPDTLMHCPEVLGKNNYAKSVSWNPHHGTFLITYQRADEVERLRFYSITASYVALYETLSL